MIRAPAHLRFVPHLCVGALIVGVVAPVLAIPMAVVVLAASVVSLVVAATRGWRVAGLAVMMGALAVGAMSWSSVRILQTEPAVASERRDVVGIVDVDSLPTTSAAGRSLRVRVVTLGRNGPPAGSRLIARLPTNDTTTIRWGHRLRVAGTVAPATAVGSPSWWRRYLARNAITGRLRLRTLHVVGTRGGVVGVRDDLRNVAHDGAGRGHDGDVRELVRGMTFGGGGELSDDTEEAFRDAGISHLLAVSGQNIVIVSGAVFALLLAVGLRRRTAAIVSVGVIVVYWVMCDGGPSVVRAAVVGLLGLACQLRSRSIDRWYLLLVGLAAILIHQPRAIFDPGLHLSFCAVVGLITIARPIEDWMGGWLPKRVAAFAAQAAAASIATAPAVIGNFGELSIVGLIVNVVAVPLAAPVVVVSLAGIVTGALITPLGVALGWCAGLGAIVLIGLSHAAAALPGASVTLPSWFGIIGAAVAVGIGAAILGLRKVPRRRSTVRRRAIGTAWAAIAVALAMVVVPTPAQPTPWPRGAAVTALDVGQGDAILLRSPAGAAVVIDAGPPDAEGDGAPVVRALRRAGVRRIDVLVVTHDHRDHTGGVSAVLREFTVREIALARSMPGVEGLARTNRTPVRRVVPGDQITVDVWRLDVLWPPADVRVEDLNDSSLVLRAEAPGLSALLPGDAESQVLARLLLGPVDVLKVSHHGSDDPGLPGLLRRLRPASGIISAGAGNSFGHPRSETLDALAASATVVERTDREGDVTVEADRSRDP